MIKRVIGNLLTANNCIVAHQCNCQGAYNAGVAKAIRNRYSNAYSAYMKACNHYAPSDLIGHVQFVKCESDYFTAGSSPNQVIVANMFSQLNYGRIGVHTDYVAFRKCCESIVKVAKQRNLTVAMPCYIGCGLAGGDWNTVYSILVDCFTDVDLTLYEL